MPELGDASHVTFLAEQSAATKDKYVRRAIAKAIAAIEKRTKTP